MKFDPSRLHVDRLIQSLILTVSPFYKILIPSSFIQG